MSNADEDEKLAELESEAERSRAELSETVDDIKDKIVKTTSPSVVKQEVKEYVQRSSEQLIDKLVRSANDNPLHAVIVAVGVGYPVWRLCSRLAREHPAAFVSAAALTGYTLLDYVARKGSGRSGRPTRPNESRLQRPVGRTDVQASTSQVRIVPASDHRA